MAKANVAIITLNQSREWLELPLMAGVVGGTRRAADQLALSVVIHQIMDTAEAGQRLQDLRVEGALVFIPSSFQPAAIDRALASLRRHLPVVWVMGAEMGANGVDHVTHDRSAARRGETGA